MIEKRSSIGVPVQRPAHRMFHSAWPPLLFINRPHLWEKSMSVTRFKVVLFYNLTTHIFTIAFSLYVNSVVYKYWLSAAFVGSLPPSGQWRRSAVHSFHADWSACRAVWPNGHGSPHQITWLWHGAPFLSQKHPGTRGGNRCRWCIPHKHARTHTHTVLCL